MKEKNANAPKLSSAKIDPKIFAAIPVRFTERALQSNGEKNRAEGKEQKIRPRKIASDRKLNEEDVAEKSEDRENEPDPKRRIPTAFHRDLLTDT